MTESDNPTSNPTYLGVFDGHNAAAAVFADGAVRHIIQEERLTGVKNHFGPPDRAVEAVLGLAGLQHSDVDGVCFSSRYLSVAREPGYMKTNFDERYHRDLRHSVGHRLTSLKSYRDRRTRQRMEERRQLASGWGFAADKVQFHDHHASHAATAYFGLRRDDDPYLILTLDGGGDGLSGSVWIGQGGRLERLATIDQENSLGELYAVTTHLLGFMPLEHEYKLMGMAPYASQQYGARIAQLYHRYLSLDASDPLTFRRHVPEPLSLIGPRLQKDLGRSRFDSICCGLQMFTEELMAQWVSACVAKTGISRILAAGGVFMNVKANKAISELDQVAAFEAFPSCGDESLPFGACYLAAQASGCEHIGRLDSCYLGNDLGLDECRQAVQTVGADKLDVEEPADMGSRVAALLAQGEIVARASGPMEFGARALGNRSILADPVNQDVVRIINRMIKRRDFWMPFAPVVLRRQADRCFLNPKGLPSPYMMNTFDSTDTRGEFMAAVHNADLTARPQLLEAGQNPPYESILHHFAELTGRHVLLNTSFNLHGFPVVCSAQDALGVLMNSGLTRLVLGPLLVSKKC